MPAILLGHCTTIHTSLCPNKLRHDSIVRAEKPHGGYSGAKSVQQQFPYEYFQVDMLRSTHFLHFQSDLHISKTQGISMSLQVCQMIPYGGKDLGPPLLVRYLPVRRLSQQPLCHQGSSSGWVGVGEETTCTLNINGSPVPWSGWGNPIVHNSAQCVQQQVPLLPKYYEYQ